MIYVLYHRSCMDGTGAKYAAWKKLGTEGVQYVDVQYGEPFPDLPYQSSDTVYIVDFSYSRDIILKQREVCRVIVIDHHETAETELADLPDAFFDSSKSGAVMTWEYFHPDKPIPVFLLLLQDYDLWKWEMTDTMDMTTVFESDVNREDLEYLDNLIQSAELFYSDDSTNEEPVANSSVTNVPTPISGKPTPHKLTYQLYLGQGAVAAAPMKKQIHGLISKKRFIVKRINGRNVALFNTTIFYNMLNHAVNKLPGIDYSMSYFMLGDGGIVFSFRSKKGDMRVNDLAKALGGGGHKHSAGASIPFPRSLEVLKSFYDSPTVEENEERTSTET